MIARLRPGATIEQVNGQMKAIVDRNAERLPALKPFWTSSGFRGFAVPLREQLAGDTRAPLFVLFSLPSRSGSSEESSVSHRDSAAWIRRTT